MLLASHTAYVSAAIGAKQQADADGQRDRVGVLPCAVRGQFVLRFRCNEHTSELG
jgi:hypothetical protein